LINNSHQFIFRFPEKKDAKILRRLIANSPPLDINSLYCYLLVCTHFAQTSVLVENSKEICGFISAYMRPDRNDTLFVWQVAVSKNYRGQGIASDMLASILRRTYPAPLRYLETTVNPSNISSNTLFSRLANSIQAPLVKSLLFSESDFGSSEHEEEIMYRIGPFNILRKEEM
jgi:L-2,4-diaminobutyric acid acetyltransferase